MFEYLKENIDVESKLKSLLNISSEQAKDITKKLSLGDVVELTDLLNGDSSSSQIEKFLNDAGVKPKSINKESIVQSGDNKMSKKEINEGIMGSLVGVPSLSRLRDLAGIRSGVTEDVDTSDFANEYDYYDTQPEIGDMSSDEYAGIDDEFSAVPVSSERRLRQPPVVEPELEPEFNEPVVQTPVVQDAYNEIQDHINAITTRMVDVRIADYKPLLNQLEALVTELRGRGLDALREHASTNRVSIKKK